jgi:hypothetical protein
MPRFEIHTKTLFLTYSQLSDDEQLALFENPTSHYDFVCDRLRDPVCYRLARERHQDGGVHAHCYITFSSPVRIRSQHRLDFGTAHPNIQSVRKGHRRTWEYCGKEDDVIYDFGEPPSESGRDKTSDHAIWTEIASQETEADLYERCRTLAPKYYVLYRQNLERYCAWRFNTGRTEYSGPEIDADLPAPVQEWIDQSDLGRHGGERRKSLIIWGPSLTGKTVWARSVGRYAPM